MKSSLTSGVDHAKNFIVRKDVRQFFLNRRFNDVDPVPLAFKYVFVEELKAASIRFDSGSGVSQDKGVKLLFKLIDAEVIRAAVEVCANATNGARVDVNGGVGFALTTKRVKMLFV